MKLALVLLFAAVTLAAPLRAAPPTAAELYGPQNLHAWCVVPFDARKRGPEERAAMLEGLGFKRFVYDWRGKDIPTFDAEIEAMKKHGIEITAWWSPTNAHDKVLQTTLNVFQRQNVHPQLWVMGGGAATTSPEEQAKRVETEAHRIREIVELAAPYGCAVELYNHNGWFGQPANEVAIIEQLQKLGVSGVGMVYNFSHGHQDIDDFSAIWKRIQPYVVAVNLTGMKHGGDSPIFPPSQGDQEMAMMKTILDSGWRGPVGLIAEQGGDAEVTLGHGLNGTAWIVKELTQPGSGGERPNLK